MAKKVTKKTGAGSKKKTAKKAGARSGSSGGRGSGAPTSASGKKLVIVESPAKAKTINKYLGSDYVVRASVGHIRDLPSKNPKGVKSPVPGVDLEDDFRPSYEPLPGKSKTVTELKKLGREASEVWFATDLDREGEAIAWHLAEILGVDPGTAKRVVFNAITKGEIERAFRSPQSINMHKVDAQQARRILDRIVGYQVSPLLWKKVSRGLSAGRVQSVAVRLVVQREREIRAFVPDESWRVTGRFALSESEARRLVGGWASLMGERDEKGNGPTIKRQNQWLAEHNGVKGELVEVGGEAFDISQAGRNADGSARTAEDLTARVAEVARLVGLGDVSTETKENESGRGPARFERTVSGVVDPSVAYRVRSIETKRTTSRPPAPFITSTLQQGASSRLGFGAQRTMRAAQRLYEGVEIPGEGAVGLITYMRTDSTHLSGDALSMARDYIGGTFGDRYLPEKPNFFGSSNKAAQEAHEAIRPTTVRLTPDDPKIKKALGQDEHKLYRLIWERFVACQMASAEWDATTVLIEGGTDRSRLCVFKATGRTLAFDGFMRVSGVPTASDEQTLPALSEGKDLSPFAMDAEQRFSSPPARYSEASLIKTLESEGIGRPSTYASIIQVIQDRKYVEQVDRRFYATDLGEVVTDKLIEAFPELMELGYTRDMESRLDDIEEANKDWVRVLHEFYDPFRLKLERAHENLEHAKAETQESEYLCPKCGKPLVYRFGKNGRFLSCSDYPACDYACPTDREGRPRPAEFVDVKCPKTGRPMMRRTGRFGPFLTTVLLDGEAPSVGMILNIDKKGHVTAPSPPPLLTDLPCPKCSSPLNLRDGIRGPWLGCSNFPKCRGRGKWAELPEEQRAALEKELAAHLRQHPIPIITTLTGRALTDASGKPVKDAPTVEQLLIDSLDDPRLADVDLSGGSLGLVPKRKRGKADAA
ncbi:MAG: DNA topoisomerase [Phycisphaerales bacterium]